jgi:perosamine synthetase
MKIDCYSPTIRRKEMDAVLTTMVDDRVGPGELSIKLAQCAKEYMQFEYCLTLRSPAIALSVALRALQIERGGGVLISALSPWYYIKVIEECGLLPIYFDVDDASACATAETISRATSSVGLEGTLPRCIVLHHSLGYVPDVPAISELGIPIIEDCSLSYGANWGEQKVGSFGVFTILGLEEKHVLTAGGGALLYSNSKRDGIVLKSWAELPLEYKLPDLNAAMAVVQFKEAEKNFMRRKEIAQNYLQAALRTRHKRFLQPGDAEYNNYAFPLVLETGMKDVRSYALKKEVIIENAFEDTLMGRGLCKQETCPNAYSLSLRTALFPLYPRLTASQVEKVAKVIATLP